MLVQTIQWVKQLFTSVLLIALTSSLFSMPGIALDDGPYLRYLKEDSLVAIQWVCDGKAHTQVATLAQGRVVPPQCRQRWPIGVPEKLLANPQTVFQANKVAVIADVHGQFDLATKLLQAQHIIDGELNWQFGQNHLVVLGDMMGRGPQVTELLWFLYELEQQAAAAGGMVHVMIGNHEALALQGDIRYVNQKYQTTSELLKQPYQNLFDEHTVLGRWLRTKPVIIKVNSMLIVHAGVHPDLLTLGMDMQQLNKRFNETLGMSRTAIRTQPDLAFLYGRDGPLWLRDYFSGRDAMPVKKINKVLRHFDAEHIAVGHTSFNAVYQHYKGKVISVDSDIKRAEQGELLIWQANGLWRGNLHGEVLPIPLYQP